MTDINRLKVLAERATPGPWSAAWEEGDDTAWPNLFPVIQAGNGEVVIGNEGFYTDLEQDKANATFCAAANPQAILGLIDEVERLEEELSQCASALSGTYYMDPPDGGNVSIPEQIRRMAKDAARYRGLRDEGYLHNWASLHVCDEHLRAQRTDEAIDSVLNIGAKQ
ncbi:TPA: ead/Ea22-like family protein [Pseudomonas aeruginosa]|nr:ead/Ea22-like family protein [Pseudomonas aeruginosa]